MTLRGRAVRTARGAGEGNLGCIVWVLIAGIIGLVLFKFVPVKIHTAQLKDYVSEQAQFVSRKDTSESIKKRILRKADELALDIEPSAVKVVKGREAVRVDLKFTIPLEFPGYTYDYVVDETIERKIFNF